MGEIEAAAQNGLPDLIKYEDIRGTLHNHSTWSDGMHALRQMIDAAYARGYSYYSVCDHSRSLVIANGLSIERVYEQQKEIRELNKAYGNDLRVFSGTECDILADGSLDYPDDVLATFDLVVAAIHTRFEMSEKEATERFDPGDRKPVHYDPCASDRALVAETKRISHPSRKSHRRLRSERGSP